MRKTKRVIAQFTFYDRTGIQKYLENQAENGWMLEKISPLGWKFRRIEPKKLHFTVNYFHKASVFDPEPTEQQRTFQEFCAHAGWQLVGSNGPMQVFCNEAEDPLPIETDPLTELAAIHATAKKNFLPSYIMLLFVVLMNIALQIGQLWTFPLSYLNQNTTIFNWLCQLCLLTMCCQEIFGYFLWYRKAKRAAAETDSFVETRGHRKSQLVLLTIVMAAFGWLLLTLWGDMATAFVVVISGVFVVYAVVFGLQAILKRLKFSREVNRATTIWTTVILTVIMTVALFNGIVDGVMSNSRQEKNDAEAYQANGLTFYAYDHELPLYVEDLTETDYDRYSNWANETGSILLTVREYKQETRVGRGEQAPELRYEVYDVHLPLLYGICKTELLSAYENWSSEDIYGNVYHDEYRAVDAAPWGAAEAYRLYNAVEPYNWYLLCYEDRLVTVQFNWEPNKSQMAVVGDVLGK